MTPAVRLLQQKRIAHVLHEYAHDPRSESYGLEAAEALGVEPARVFKTLLVSMNGDPRKLAVGVVPVNAQLDLKAMAAAAGVKKVAMADPAQAEKITGYVVGGISPLGQKRLLPTVLDATAQHYPTVYVSGGRRGLDIELAPGDLLGLVRAAYAGIARG